VRAVVGGSVTLWVNTMVGGKFRGFEHDEGDVVNPETGLTGVIPIEDTIW
jgi:hypothetical protein